MNKKFISFFLFILIVSLSIFFLYNTKDKNIPKFWDNETEKTKTSKDTEIYNQSSSIIKDAEQKLQEQKKQDITLINQAWQTWDIKMCEGIIDEKLKINCQDNAYLYLAGTQNDKKHCVKVKDASSREKCLDNFSYNEAINTKNLSDCKKIRQEWLKENCLSTLVFQQIESPEYNEDIKICQELQEHNKDYCEQVIKNKNSQKSDGEFLQTAISGNTLTGCDVIINENLKKWCQDTINIKLAFSTKDKNKCNLIHDTARKTSCLESFSKEDDKNYFTQAMTTQNKTLCEKIIQNDMRSKCFDMIFLKTAIANKDAKQCTLILDTSMKQECEKVLTN